MLLSYDCSQYTLDHQYFDAVALMTGREAGLSKVLQQFQKVHFGGQKVVVVVIAAVINKNRNTIVK